MTQDSQPQLFDGQVTTLIEAWSTTIDHISELAVGLTDDQWITPSPCPGWTVGDVVAHVVAVERQLAGDSLAPHEPDWAALTHVRDDEFSRFMEVGVDARRGASRDEIIAELFEVIPRRAMQLNSLEPNPEVIVAGPAGSQIPLGRIMRMRGFDLWVHEQDIRSTIDAPGHDASLGAHVTADTLVSSLPMLLGKKVGVEPGTSLRFDVAGGISFRCQVQVGPDGRAGFVPLSSDEPTAAVALDWLTFVALGTGRTSFDAVHDRVVISGDQDLARRALELANVAP